MSQLQDGAATTCTVTIAVLQGNPLEINVGPFNALHSCCAALSKLIETEAQVVPFRSIRELRQISHLRCIVIPGGLPAVIRKALNGRSGRLFLKSFVERGGTAVGICAGAALLVEWRICASDVELVNDALWSDCGWRGAVNLFMPILQVSQLPTWPSDGVRSGYYNCGPVMRVAQHTRCQSTSPPCSAQCNGDCVGANPDMDADSRSGLANFGGYSGIGGAATDSQSAAQLNAIRMKSHRSKDTQSIVLARFASDLAQRFADEHMQANASLEARYTKAKVDETSMGWICRVCLNENPPNATRCSAPMHCCSKSPRNKNLPPIGDMLGAVAICSTAYGLGRSLLFAVHIENHHSTQTHFAELVFQTCVWRSGTSCVALRSTVGVSGSGPAPLRTTSSDSLESTIVCRTADHTEAELIARLIVDLWPNHRANKISTRLICERVRRAIFHASLDSASTKDSNSQNQLKRRIVVASIQSAAVSVAGFSDGFCVLPTRWELDLIGVTSVYRNQGVGRQLVRAQMEAAMIAGCHVIRALVRVGNRASEQLFEHMEFSKSSHAFELFVAESTNNNHEADVMSDEHATLVDDVPSALNNTTLLVVETLQYHGVWIEDDCSRDVLRAGKSLQAELDLQLTGILVTSDTTCRAILRAEGFNNAGLFHWWSKHLK